jgi:hypothetical protein
MADWTNAHRYEKRQTVINDVPVKQFVLKDRVPKIKWDFHDAQGTVQFAECEVSLSNITKEALPIVQSKKVPELKFYINGKKFFQGQLLSDGIEYDKDMERIVLKFINEASRVGDILDSINIRALASGRDRILENVFGKAITNETNGAPEISIFEVYRISDIFSAIEKMVRQSDPDFEAFSIEITGIDAINTFMLDYDRDRDLRTPNIPDWSAKDFFYSLAKAYNCIAWYDGRTKVFHIASKKTFINDDAGYVVFSVKNTKKQSDKSLASSGIVFKWKDINNVDAPLRIIRNFGVRRSAGEVRIAEPWFTPSARTITIGDGTVPKISTIQQDFQQPMIWNGNARIPLLAMPGLKALHILGMTGTRMLKVITLEDIAKFFEFEVAEGAGDMAETTHSLLADSEILEFFPFVYKKFSIDGISKYCYATGMELDIAKAQLKLRGVIYPPGSVS